jgi:hypothetical protein
LFGLVAAAAAPAAWAEPWLDDEGLGRLFAGRSIEGTVTVGPGREVRFAEDFAPDGAWNGHAASPGGGALWSWHGVWTVEGGALCRAAVETNTRECARIAPEGPGFVAARDAGKLGAPGLTAAVARFAGTDQGIAGWTASALAVLILAEGP